MMVSITSRENFKVYLRKCINEYAWLTIHFCVPWVALKVACVGVQLAVQAGSDHPILGVCNWCKVYSSVLTITSTVNSLVTLFCLIKWSVALTTILRFLHLLI